MTTPKTPSKTTKRKPAKRKPKPVVISSPWRKVFFGGISAAGLVAVIAWVTWAKGGIDLGPSSDSVSIVFDLQESEFRRLSVDRAAALRAGEIKSESESVQWMAARFIPIVESSWLPLLTEEKNSFGGEKWTPEREAQTVEKYGAK
jgi:hypothetical protein